MNAKVRERSWPADGLERIGRCPLCAGTVRSLLYTNLTDRVFRVAPGRWDLWSCESCGSAYIDPRPNKSTIALAYSSYFTHAVPPPVETKTLFQRLRHALGNGYRNWRFGTRARPSVPLAHFIIRLFPEARRDIDIRYCFLPRAKGQGKRVLDVGCGSGAFLHFAASAGWEIAGVEPDTNARAVASTGGADIRRDLADWTAEEGSFDYITANHVIEHVHDPVRFAKQMFALLRSGGGLFVETPNIRSAGHMTFADDWRDLDPPRHLVLFNKNSLEATLRGAGFEDIRFHPRPNLFAEVGAQSMRIRHGLDPFSSDPIDVPAPPKDVDLATDCADFLTVTALKR